MTGSGGSLPERGHTYLDGLQERASLVVLRPVEMDQEEYMFVGKWAGVLLLSGVLLVGCASYDLERMAPGSVTLDQVKAKEKPNRVWKNADGTVTLEYDDRPLSGQNLMMDFDAQGHLQATREVLTRVNLERLKRGMHREEILRILGNPRYTWVDGRGGEVWEWPLDGRPENGIAAYVIEVHFHPKVDGVTEIRRGTRFN